MDYKHELRNRIQRLLNGEWDVPQFEQQFYFFFLEQVPDAALSDQEAEFFSRITEKLDFTAQNPGEDQQVGYLDYPQFKQWLQHHYQQFYAQVDR